MCERMYYVSTIATYVYELRVDERGRDSMHSIWHMHSMGMHSIWLYSIAHRGDASVCMTVCVHAVLET